MISIPRRAAACLRVLATGVVALAVAACAEEPPPAAEPPPPPPSAAPVNTPDAGPPLPRIVAGEPSIVIEEADAAPPPAAIAVKKATTPAIPRTRTVKGDAPPKGRAADAVAAIRAHHAEVEECYARVAFKDPTIAGRIVLRWTLAGDGRPTAVAVQQDTLRDPSVAACIRERARKWKFPPPSGGVAVVTYPFDLRIQ